MHPTPRLAIAFLLLAGCARKEMPPPEKKFDITASDAMRFAPATIDALPGQKCTLTLTNISTTPELVMAHNLTLLQQGTDPNAFVQAGLAHAATDYIAPDQKQNVLASTKMLAAGETDTITFTAPATSGTYDFICTYPGHFAGGMKGALVVRP